MSNLHQIQWFPGHMAKAKKELRESLKLVDVAVELVDARIPISSQNKDLQDMIADKSKLLVFCKSDMADEKETLKWLNFYKKQNASAIPFSTICGNDKTKFIAALEEILSEKISNWKSKGMAGRKVRAMVLGIPNVGKSSFINKIIGRKKAAAQNKPGVTRKNQWFSVSEKVELLDTPGILQPKIESERAAKNLAFTGAIKEEILNTEELALDFLDVISENYLENLTKRYDLKIEEILNAEPLEKLEMIAKKRGMLVLGGETDLERAAKMILNEFKSLKLGRITLEQCEKYERK